jgi:hypothetical protein
MIKYLPLLSTIVTLVFAGIVFGQYLSRRKPYQLVWALALVIFAIATGSEFLGNAFGWTEATYRSWYLCGAMFGVAYLALGTIYLLAPRRWAHIVAGLLVLASIYPTFRVLTAPVDMQLALASGTISGTGFPADVRLMTPFFNVFGTVVLVGGALYSAYVFWRRRTQGNMVLSNILIAGGALLIAAGGAFSRFGIPELLFVSELLGIVVIFAGFLLSRQRHGDKKASKQQT